MPRLHDFHIKHPQIDLHLVAELNEPNFHKEVVDIGICHGIGDQHALEHTFLFCDYVYPVISSELLQKQPLTQLEDLAKTVLLHDSVPQAKLSTSWSRWLLEHGVCNIDCSSGYRFNQVDLIVRAVLDSRGVALGRHVLVAKEIKRGRLQPLFNDYERDDGVYLVCLKKKKEQPQVAAF
ncbi:MAG: LysR substrate-binding domain-containing protein [Marinomonas sp.]